MRSFVAIFVNENVHSENGISDKLAKQGNQHIFERQDRLLVYNSKIDLFRNRMFQMTSFIAIKTFWRSQQI